MDRHRDEFRDFILEHVDVLFANQDEVVSLYLESDLWDAVERARGDCALAVVTRSKKGSIVVSGDETHTVSAAPVERVVDTTGAGDLFAAGFLYGLTHGHDLPACGRIGALAAAAR